MNYNIIYYEACLIKPNYHIILINHPCKVYDVKITNKIMILCIDLVTLKFITWIGAKHLKIFVFKPVKLSYQVLEVEKDNTVICVDDDANIINIKTDICNDNNDDIMIDVLYFPIKQKYNFIENFHLISGIKKIT